MLRTHDEEGQDLSQLYEIPFYFDLSKVIAMRPLEETDLPLEFRRKTAITFNGSNDEHYVKASIDDLLKLLGGSDGGIEVLDLPEDTPVAPKLVTQL